MPVVNFTAEFLASGLVCPTGQRKVQFCDADLPGLLLEVNASGASSWYVRYKVEGKTKYQGLGKFPDMPLNAARNAAKEFKAPSNPLRADLTLDDFVRRHVNPHNKVHKRSHSRDLELYQRIGPRFGHLKLADISRREAQAFHLELMDKEGLAPATADQHLAYLRHVLNMAVEWDYLQANQLAKVRLLKVDNQVQRFLSDEETRRLVQVLHTDPASGQSAIFLFLLNTGARKGEALNALWEHVDRERPVRPS